MTWALVLQIAWCLAWVTVLLLFVAACGAVIVAALCVARWCGLDTCDFTHAPGEHDYLEADEEDEREVWER